MPAQNDAPLVSVIIAAYQQPAFLNAALASIAAQTHANTEILIVDDASSPEFTDQYRLPENARLFVNPARNATASISRNTALGHATGEYVAFLDQDDLWHPEKLAIQLAALRAQPDAVLHFTHYESVDEHLTPLPRQRRLPRLGTDPVRSLLRRNIIQCPSLVMMPRAAVDRLHLFDAAIRGAADWDMWLRAAAIGPILFDPRPLVRYRTHPHQWSKSSLMLAKGCYAVAAKAARWIPPLRPDLHWPLRYREARWLREIARIQLLLNEECDQSMGLLRRSAALFPFDVRTYPLMMRAAARRARPSTRVPS